MNAIKHYILQCRQFFIYAGIFSFVINLMTLMPAFYMLELYDRVLSSHSNETLVMLTILVVFMLLVQYYVEYLRQSLFLRTSATMQRLMQKTVLACMLNMQSQSRANRRGLDDVHTVQSFFSGSGVQAVFEVPWIPVYFFVLYLFHPWLCLMAVVGTLILVALTYLEEKVSAESQKQGQDALRQSQDMLDSALNNLEAINAMSMREAVTSRWSKVHDKALSHNIQSATKSASIAAWSRLVRNLLSTLALAVAAWLAINDRTVTPGVMIAATIIMGKVMVPIDRVISGWRFFIKARHAYSRLNKMLADYNPDTINVTLQHVEGHLRVEKLFFAVSREREILRNLNFELIAGEALGVIGNSAAGKSTLTRLLVGLYKPTAGAVRMDGADIFQWSQTGLLGPHIGYLPQAVELFSGTVAENIARMAEVGAHVDKVIEAARLVGAHDFILRLPQGYDTEIGEGGRLLSSGQRQLVGLARALFGTPKLVVLDEPNANLDGPSELAFMRMIREVKARKITLVIVSHKPSVLRDVDKLLVLEQGRQVNFGRRDDIMHNTVPSDNTGQVALVKGAQPA
ncbi:type I secretion system permease/ATPase [Methylovorus menthalis]|uniref:type I secretion system permease/ATPase n=1 Tax=Methylovorus menthalis TaxID=1002227 RepID=UPI001E5F363B|nr:type I secretion system permease/ATPase [Methylovorus menthalis]MCB4812294.1 type I secretion system permease/ATPase [Methylovorus menthalis]